MALKFKSVNDRNATAGRLYDYARDMAEACSQGGRCLIASTQVMMEDIFAAAAIVACCDIEETVGK